VDSDRLNRWLTLVANVGVLVGIFLLIIEIAQNNELMQAQIEQSRSETLVAWRREVVGNESIARLLAKVEGVGGLTLGGLTRESIGQLNPVELVQLRMLVTSEFYDFENLYSQYERGFVSEEYWRERIVPTIRRRAVSWQLLYPPDGPIARRAFKDEVKRILQAPVEAPAP